jgi:bifunctional DNase/RNase
MKVTRSAGYRKTNRSGRSANRLAVTRTDLSRSAESQEHGLPGIAAASGLRSAAWAGLRRPEVLADALGRSYNGPLRRSRRERKLSSVQEMVIYGVSFDMVGKQPIVLLKTVDGNKFLPIWIGHPEAAAILMKLQGATTPRPMTHDLISDMISELDATCTRVAVTELKENTFFASITLRVNGQEVEIDSRPSDALAVAVRTSAPIFAAEEVIQESAIEFEHEVEDTEEVVDKFKRFLDEVTPEDFAQGAG